MGRSISVPSNAEAVVYASLAHEEDEDLARMHWDDSIVNLTSALRARRANLSKCDKWIGREDHALLTDGKRFIGVSEYCGMVAIWSVVRDDYDQDEDDQEPLVRGLLDASIEQHLAESVEDAFGEALKRQGWTAVPYFPKLKEAA